MDNAIDLGPVVQKVDGAIHRINHYLADSTKDFVNTYPLVSDLYPVEFEYKTDLTFAFIQIKVAIRAFSVIFVVFGVVRSRKPSPPRLLCRLGTFV